LLALHVSTLEDAPRITALVALIVQTLPAVLLATSRTRWLSARILACDIRTGWVGLLRSAILLLAPLAGPVSGTLAPLFLLRAILDRSSARLVQTILLGLPTLLQTIIVLTHPEPARAAGIGVPLLALQRCNA
jgi:hypothetical protein